MKNLFLLFLFLTIISCNAQDCPQSINKLPMYGNAVKCKEQIAADERFLEQCKKDFKNAKEASEYYANRGWQYLRKDSFGIAMKRFNQAWLLDSTNANVFWGYGALLGKEQDYPGSIKYFDKAIQMDSANIELYNDAVISLGQQYYQTKDAEYLRMAIMYLMFANKIESTDGRTLANLAKCYYSLQEIDSAKKYIELTDKQDPKLIPVELRQEVYK